MRDNLLLPTPTPDPGSVLPSLPCWRTACDAPADVSALLTTESAHAVLVDARTDLAAARNLCRLPSSTASIPVRRRVDRGWAHRGQMGVELDDFLSPTPGPPSSTHVCGC